MGEKMHFYSAATPRTASRFCMYNGGAMHTIKACGGNLAATARVLRERSKNEKSREVEG